MQRVVLGQGVVLEAEFLDGRGALIDPPAVTVSVLDYDQVERVSNDQPSRLSLGRYAYAYLVPADGPVGAWTIRWDAEINGAPAGGVEAFDVVAAGQVVVQPPAAADDPLVTVAQLRTYAALPELDEVQTAATQAHLDALVAGLERALNRSLTVRTFQEKVTTLADGRVILGQTPVVEILEVLDYPWVGGLTSIPVRFAGGVELVVRYRAGFDMRSDLHIRSVVMDKALAFVRALLAQDATAGGATGGGSGLVVPTPPSGIKSFAVEGLNVTYESATERQSAALKAATEMAAATAWTPAELDGLALSRLRKRVVA